MNHRHATVDLAKGLGIILVVLGHSWFARESDALFRVIFSFHMPLFFFLAGVFINVRSETGRFIAGRADALLRPYFSVLILFGTLKYAAAVLGKKPGGFDLLAYFEGLVYATGHTVLWVAPWFLPHLFVSVILSLGVLKALAGRPGSPGQTGRLLACALAMLALGRVTMNLFWRPVMPEDENAIGIHGLPGLPWSLDLAPVTAAFVVAGYALREQVKPMRFHTVGFLMAAAVFAGLHCWFHGTMDLNLRRYGHPLITTVQAVAGIYLVLALAAGWVRSGRLAWLAKGLAYIGAGSIFILMFHISTPRAVRSSCCTGSAIICPSSARAVWCLARACPCCCGNWPNGKSTSAGCCCRSAPTEVPVAGQRRQP